MFEAIKIPMFPLVIFPLPGELVPLHVFENRYRQLLEDAEKSDFSFGIFFNHVSNTQKLGSLVQLESVIKRYPDGESDIIVKCTDLFEMDKLYRTHLDKLYPGGDVHLWNVDLKHQVGPKLKLEFDSYLLAINTTRPAADASLYHVANELSLDLNERMKFVLSDQDKKELFLIHQLHYQKQLLLHVEKSKDVFHLN